LLFDFVVVFCFRWTEAAALYCVSSGSASVDRFLGMMILVGERRGWLKLELHPVIAS